MKFTLTMKCDNAAFADPDRDNGESDFDHEAMCCEVARILREIASYLDNGSATCGAAVDQNGNTVGGWAFG